MKEGVARLRAKWPKARVIGATVVSALGSSSAAHGFPEQDAKRKALNEFIRTSGTFDGVIDFDKARSIRPRAASSRSSFPRAPPAAPATSFTPTVPDIWRWARPSTSICSSRVAAVAARRSRMGRALAKPITVLLARKMMGFAALYPSYGARSSHHRLHARHRRDQIAELGPADFEIAVLVERGAGRRQQHHGIGEP